MKTICPRFEWEGDAIPVNIFVVFNRLKSGRRARLLPSWRRHGSAGASPPHPPGTNHFADRLKVEEWSIGEGCRLHIRYAPYIRFFDGVVEE